MLPAFAIREHNAQAAIRNDQVAIVPVAHIGVIGKIRTPVNLPIHRTAHHSGFASGLDCEPTNIADPVGGSYNETRLQIV